MKRVRESFAGAALAAAVAASVSCGDVVRQGRSPMLVTVDLLQGAVTTKDGVQTFGVPLMSDVITGGTIFNDLGSAVLRAVPKNVTTTTAPTTNNDVTITHVHINYRRADGRNTPGVDVPYPFDGGATVTLPSDGTEATVVFDLVRNAAKLEPPLIDLRTKLTVLTAIAEVTFYGTDRVGNDISAIGYITVNFADFGDPQ